MENKNQIDVDLATETLINSRHPYGAFHYLERAALNYGLDAYHLDNILKTAISMCIADKDDLSLTN